MADDWETAADAAEVAPVAVGGSEIPGTQIKAKKQWDDEDAPEPEPEVVSKGPTPVAKPKALSQAKIEKKRLEMEREAAAEAKSRASDPKQALAHKQALLKQQEDAGKKDIEALFGGSNVGDDGPKREKRSNPDPLKALELKTAAQFDLFANDVAKKILPTDQEKTRKEATTFLKTLLKAFGARLDSDNLREVSSVMTVVLNEKIREEAANKKSKGKKAKSGPALKSLNANTRSSAVEEQQAVASTNTDEYDFL